MKRRKINIAVLALFQLLIFVAPFSIKAAHHHESGQTPSLHVFSEKAISKEVRCFICNFEFVTFDIPNLSPYFFLQWSCDADFIVSVEKGFMPFISYFSLRAPPKF